MAYVDSWVGAPTETSFVVGSMITGATAATLYVSSVETLSGARSYPMMMTDADGTLWKATATGLGSGRQYYWGIGADGAEPTKLGTARTATAGAHSFSFWSSSCANTGSSAPVFSTILGLDPDFGCHLGDLHYRDATDYDGYMTGYSQAIAGQGHLYRNVPLYYMPDDHDGMAQWASSNRPELLRAYYERVPHPNLPNPTGGLYQTWARGRVRMILLDPRTMAGKDPGSRLSLEQREWLFDTLLASTEALAIIGTGVPWMGTDSDSWGGASWQAERLIIAEWLVANGWKDRVILFAGDQHSIAYDDGSHNVWGGLGAPVFQTAALYRNPTNKGGTYTRPAVLDRNQFGLWRIVDDGGTTITVHMDAYSQGAKLYTETYAVATTAAPPVPPIPGMAPRRGAALSLLIA